MCNWCFNVLVVKAEEDMKEQFEAFKQWLTSRAEEDKYLNEDIDVEELKLTMRYETRNNVDEEFINTIRDRFPDLHIAGSWYEENCAEVGWFSSYVSHTSDNAFSGLNRIWINEDEYCSCMMAKRLAQEKQDMLECNDDMDEAEVDEITGAWITEYDDECACEDD